MWAVKLDVGCQTYGCDVNGDCRVLRGCGGVLGGVAVVRAVVWPEMLTADESDEMF